MLATTAAGPVVVPRRVDVGCAPGEPAVAIAPEGRVDEACLGSMLAAWSAALRLAGSGPVSGAVRFAGARRVAGGSAGLVVGVLAFAALRGLPAPSFLASGAVVDARGRLEGGVAGDVKAQAAGEIARQLGLPRPVRLLLPPRETVPDAADVDVRVVRTLAEALHDLGLR